MNCRMDLRSVQSVSSIEMKLETLLEQRFLVSYILTEYFLREPARWRNFRRYSSWYAHLSPQCLIIPNDLFLFAFSRFYKIKQLPSTSMAFFCTCTHQKKSSDERVVSLTFTIRSIIYSSNKLCKN